MDYMRVNDVRNLRRLLMRYRDDVPVLCSTPSREGYSVVTAAADFGFDSVTNLKFITNYLIVIVTTCIMSLLCSTGDSFGSFCELAFISDWLNVILLLEFLLSLICFNTPGDPVAG